MVPWFDSGAWLLAVFVLASLAIGVLAVSGVIVLASLACRVPSLLLTCQHRPLYMGLVGTDLSTGNMDLDVDVAITRHISHTLTIYTTRYTLST